MRIKLVSQVRRIYSSENVPAVNNDVTQQCHQLTMFRETPWDSWVRVRGHDVPTSGAKYRVSGLNQSN